ncbi:MAG: V-type ATP synthase subunit E, partial [Simkaniaceae bacterium]|nr:V-type ATP synthase subunit E [Simkaniaceae bacterium]
NDPKILGELISAIVVSLEKEWIHGDLEALVSSKVNAEQVNKHLLKGVLDRLKEKSVVLSDMTGGAQVKLFEKNMTLDISDQALKNLVGNFLRSSFRSILFES